LGGVHDQAVRRVAISPRKGYRQALTAGFDGTTRLWDLDRGEKEMRIFDRCGVQLEDVAFSGDGRWFVSGGLDHRAQVWDVASGQLVCRFNGHTAVVACTAFSPNDSLVVSCSFGEIRIWDARTGVERSRFVPAADDQRVGRVAFTPDGERL